jgi:hypothetical protein
MSDDTNDTLNNEESMEINEIESSIENEVIQTKKYSSMSSSEFEAKLIEFFTKHQKSKLRFVKRIVTEFAGNEQEVLEHLHNRFVLGEPSSKELRKKGGKKKGGAKAVASGHDAHGAEAPKELEAGEAKPKSKKKMIIIIIIAVVVVGGGAAVFLLKDKLFGGGHGHGAEHGVEAGHDAHATEPAKDTAATTAIDTTAAHATDSAATATTPTAGTTPEHGAEQHTQGGGH